MRSEGWSPARIFLLVSAVYHLGLGAAGLAIDQTFPLSAGAADGAHSDHVFGIFETNGWHSTLGVLLGLLSAYFVARPRYAREAALAVGLSQVLTTVALAAVDPSNFLLAANGADQVVHTATAIGGIVSGLLTPSRKRSATPAAVADGG